MPFNGGTAYPTASDLQTFLTAKGLVPSFTQGAPASIDYATLIVAARKEVEADCQRNFLPTASSVMRVYDPPLDRNRILDLEADLLSVTTLQWLPYNTTTAQVFAVDQDYRLGPPNAQADNAPFQYVEFFRHFYGPHPWALKRSIQIIGTWGFSLTIPEDVWQAILLKATILILPDIAADRSQGFKSWTQQKVTEAYWEEPYGKILERYMQQYLKIVQHYRRLSIF